MGRLERLELNGFKSFANKSALEFEKDIVCIVGPNGSGKSNVVEAFRFVLGEQSMKSMRGRAGADLIFKGSKKLPKGQRASVVAHFDNSDRVFRMIGDGGQDIKLNFDTISVGREVYPDGMNKYLLNKDEVRLKDINSLLASLNIGSSGHHIISQGEADRILNANPKERKEMVEDALGLKIYQYKIRESEKKLTRSETNMKEVGLLRRENAPHLRFLKRQVDKFQKMKELKGELSSLYQDYLAKEDSYLKQRKEELKDTKEKLDKEIKGLDKALSQREESSDMVLNKNLDEVRQLESELNKIKQTKGELERKLGRIEGILEARAGSAEEGGDEMVQASEVRKVFKEINEFVDKALKAEDMDMVRSTLGRIKNSLMSFKLSERDSSAKDELRELRDTKDEISKEIKNLSSKEEDIARSIQDLKQKTNTLIAKSRDMEREKFEIKVRHQELSSALELNTVHLESLSRRERAFVEELREGSALLGGDINLYKNQPKPKGEIDEKEQEEERRKIEKIKIKLEDAGLGNEAEVMKEYNSAMERDEFLNKELEDLTKSIEDLDKIITELKEQVEIKFKEGVKKINKEFDQFFGLMFGGGNGSIKVVDIVKRGSAELGEEDKTEQGVEINVSLPRKKVKELHSLSGGERSLTSIALLFAMSQVNPPPFLILDETDAALDEANSRKYGDMLERLSKHSQLIVVTHNRETMSRAGVLYGVTIGSDGASKLLSVKFDEAVSIAK